MDSDDGKIERVIPVAGQDNSMEFNYLLQKWTSDKLFDEHLWLSVAIRPKRSNFTRAQRLTCCITYLYLMMISSCMWYRGEDNTDVPANLETDDPEDKTFNVQIGPLVFTYYQVYSSIASSIMIYPVIVLLIQIFRKTDSNTKSLREAYEDWKAFRRRNMINKGVQVISNDYYVPHLYGRIRTTTEHVWRTTKSKTFPYICIYLGWTICIIGMVTSAFFTFLYSLYWGGDVANKWLTSFLLSASETVCILSTAQVCSEFLCLKQ